MTEKDIKLAGVVRMQEGYPDDWMMCFFKIEVPSKKIPIGNTITISNVGLILFLNIVPDHILT